MPYHHHTGFYDPKYKQNQARRDLEDMLAEWYDPVYARQEAAVHADKPHTMSEVLDKVLEKTLTPEMMTAIRIREQWSTLIGAPLNRYAVFYTIRNGVAVIEVSHPAFLSELRKPEVTRRWLEKLNREFPGCNITGLWFVPQGQSAPPRQN